MTDPDPIQQFRKWYAEAVDGGIYDPAIMTLATADKDGKPSARIVLLKDFDERGFVFYTDYRSRKAEQLEVNPSAALVIHWQKLGYQVRLEGHVEKTGAEESDRYFSTRPRGSQLGAWASEQSRTVPSRKSLEESLRLREEEFRNQEVPRPPHWGGYRLVPERIEFWKDVKDRMHDRVVYERKVVPEHPDKEHGNAEEGWVSRLLAP